MNKKLGHDAIYDARELGTPRMLLLGLQHLFAMFGATVLVPILVSGYGLPLSIQTTLLFAGIGTLLFHVCTKMKIPAFLGSSFAFLGGFQAVANLDSGKFAAMTGEEKLPYALGGVVVAGLLYLVLALLFKLVGAKKVMRFFPPIVTGPIIILIGSEPVRHRRDQRLQQLVAGPVRHRHHHRGQHLGQGHDQDHPHPAGCGGQLHRGPHLRAGELHGSA